VLARWVCGCRLFKTLKGIRGGNRQNTGALVGQYEPMHGYQTGCMLFGADGAHFVKRSTAQLSSSVATLIPPTNTTKIRGGWGVLPCTATALLSRAISARLPQPSRLTQPKHHNQSFRPKYRASVGGFANLLSLLYHTARVYRTCKAVWGCFLVSLRHRHGPGGWFGRREIKGHYLPCMPMCKCKGQMRDV
jgi:hypothetical protein